MNDNIPDQFINDPTAPFNEEIKIIYPEVVEPEVTEDEDDLYWTDQDGKEHELI